MKYACNHKNLSSPDERRTWGRDFVEGCGLAGAACRWMRDPCNRKLVRACGARSYMTILGTNDGSRRNDCIQIDYTVYVYNRYST